MPKARRLQLSRLPVSCLAMQ